MSAGGQPGADASPVERAAALIEAGQARVGIEMLERHLATAPTDTDALVELARARLSLGEAQVASDVVGRAVGLAPDDPAMAITWARCRSVLGDHHGAEAGARRAAELAPDDPAVHCLLAVALGDLGRLDEAHVELAVAAEVADPTGQDQVTLEVASASVLSHRRSDRRAMLRAARRAAALAPGDPAVLQMLAARGTQAHRWWLGFGAAADAMRLDPGRAGNRPMALFCLGRAHRRLIYLQLLSTVAPLVLAGIVLGESQATATRGAAIASLAGLALVLHSWHRQRPMDRTILLLAWRTLRRFPGTVLLLALQAAVVVGLVVAVALGEVRVLGPVAMSTMGVAWLSFLLGWGPLRTASRELDGISPEGPHGTARRRRRGRTPPAAPPPPRPSRR
ncbi:hypothetical protein J4G33_06250 [Actinotalea sp. BY-33]|uniref:Tetratricopeptide repeat protein n=1 Tax=Actinotalea soli TaxID=2819234 RepID=A0A939LNN7_9CELL|nr:tetratricopeptide repeat protein [Actinotalea soli]MBO1751401.1 hypothetical protein [Actinotalea soli]